MQWTPEAHVESFQIHVREVDSMEEMGSIIFTVAPRVAIQQACQP